jgi:hypothetical protein
MRCRACNRNLTNQESTRKSVNLGDYIELCNGCFSYIKNEVPTTEGVRTDETGIENDKD